MANSFTRETALRIFGLDTNANDKEIKTAYRTLVRTYHSDKNPDNPAADELSKILNAAYEVITQPNKHRRVSYEYDARVWEHVQELKNQVDQANAQRRAQARSARGQVHRAAKSELREQEKKEKPGELAKRTARAGTRHASNAVKLTAESIQKKTTATAGIINEIRKAWGRGFRDIAAEYMRDRKLQAMKRKSQNATDHEREEQLRAAAEEYEDKVEFLNQAAERRNARRMKEQEKIVKKYRAQKKEAKEQAAVAKRSAGKAKKMLAASVDLKRKAAGRTIKKVVGITSHER